MQGYFLSGSKGDTDEAISAAILAKVRISLAAILAKVRISLAAILANEEFHWLPY